MLRQTRVPIGIYVRRSHTHTHNTLLVLFSVFPPACHRRKNEESLWRQRLASTDAPVNFRSIAQIKVRRRCSATAAAAAVSKTRAVQVGERSEEYRSTRADICNKRKIEGKTRTKSLVYTVSPSLLPLSRAGPLEGNK